MKCIFICAIYCYSINRKHVNRTIMNAEVFCTRRAHFPVILVFPNKWWWSGFRRRVTKRQCPVTISEYLWEVQRMHASCMRKHAGVAGLSWSHAVINEWQIWRVSATYFINKTSNCYWAQFKYHLSTTHDGILRIISYM